GQLQLERHVHVAALVRPADRRHAAAAQPERPALTSQRRNLQADRWAVEDRHAHFAAEDGGRNRDVHFLAQVLSVAFEPRMRPNADAQIQISCRPAPRIRRASSGRPDARAVVDAGRNPHLERSLAAVFAGGDDAPGGAREGFLERQVHGLFDVAPAARPCRPATRAAAAESAAEERVEELRERIAVAEDLLELFGRHRSVARAGRTAGRPAERTTAGGRLLVLAPVGPEFVVLAALFGIAEHFVGFVDLLA